MPQLIFTHPSIVASGSSNVLPLVVNTGADQIGWTYGLNTRHYPTYAGEVIQILSCYINNLQIGGTCASYTTGDYSNPGVEEIYGWFLLYMQVASQGAYGTTTYSEEPITMSYVDRNWTIKFQCQTAPGFNLSRDLVAPTWQITGKVVDVPEPMKNLTLNNVLSGDNAAVFGAIQDGVDLSQPDPVYNPYQDPFPGTNKKLINQQMNKELGNLGNYWQNLLQAWQQGDFSDVTGNLNGQQNSQFLTGSSANAANQAANSVAANGG